MERHSQFDGDRYRRRISVVRRLSPISVIRNGEHSTFDKSVDAAILERFQRIDRGWRCWPRSGVQNRTARNP
jgi:hypothetical protein